MTLSPAKATELLRRYEEPNQNLFFIGQHDRRITVYSQQVRALELVHALHSSGRFSPNERVAIVGGGAAGLTAETALRILGVRVELFEAADDLLNLQFGSPRLLDPRIYEWPQYGALDNRADLPILTWSRGTAAETQAAIVNASEQIEAQIQQAAPSARTRHLNVRIDGIEPIDATWRIRSGGGPPQAFTKVILACGFGLEHVIGTALPQSYWDDIGPPQPTAVDPRCLISGYGDGGLTDMMALLIDQFEHRLFTEAFLNMVSASELAAAVQTAEAAAGPQSLQSQYDLHVRPVLDSWGVFDQLRPRLIAGREVILNAHGGSLLVKDAASKLNQVMAYALQITAESQNPPQFAIADGTLDDVVDENGRQRAIGPFLPGGAPVGLFDLLVVRHGPRRNVHLSWLGGRFASFQTHRQALAIADPNSIEPPRLLNETYAFYHEAMDHLFSVPDRIERSNVREHRNRLIILQKDRARDVIVERGAQSLVNVILGNAVGIEVHLRDSPGQLSALCQVLPRTLKCAGNRITVTCQPQDHAAWTELIPSIAMRTVALPVPYSAVAAPNALSLSQAVDSVLLARLDQRLSTLWVTGYCAPLTVHQSIRDAIWPLWDVWRDTLENDPSMRAHVLQLLWKCQQCHGWDGHDDCVGNLSSAMVLMLASSLGTGGFAFDSGNARTNLIFAEGFGLGSGCEQRGEKSIDDWNDPNDWDADIVMLSSARELNFSMTGSLEAAGHNSSQSLAGASRTAPALIMGSIRWRSKLSGPLAGWLEELDYEFKQFQARRDAGIAAL